MAAQIKYELSTKVTRGEKERWQKIGVVFENERGLYGIIDNIPVGFSGMVSFFEPKEKENNYPARSEKQSSVKSGDLDEDLPF
jgi:hypothetical protein